MRELRRWLHFVRPYWRQSLWSLLLLTAMVVLDLAIPRLIQRLIDGGIAQHDGPLLLRTSLAMLGISVLSTFIAIGNNVFSVRVGEGVARDLREALFLKIQGYAFGNLDRQRTGRLLVRLTSDVNAVKGLTQVSLRIGTRAPLLMLGSLTLMFSTSSHLALRVLPLLFIAGAVSVWFVMRMEPMFQRVQERTDAVNNVLQENISGVRLVKAFVRGEFESERFEVANSALTEQALRVLTLMASMTPVLALCVNLGVTAVIWSGGLAAIHGDVSMGELVAFTNYLITTLGPLLLLSMLINMWAAGFASLKRLHEVLDSVPDVQDAPGARAFDEHAPLEVSFEDVTFRYPGERCEPVLCNVSLRAVQGQTVAILGATGAGKSSLVNLIPRFYDADSGNVRVCGQDVRALSQDSLLTHIGCVPQESVLFSGTVRDNIRYGRPGAGEEEVQRAARAAQAHDFIMQMPQGYDTPVEQRGVNLSGGQRQRIAIARALVLDPKILILDDATSAVDVETETQLQAALGLHSARRVTFVVAQRISTVLNATTIIVLEHGRVVAQGTHRELLERSDVYREIYESQLGAADELGLQLREAVS